MIEKKIEKAKVLLEALPYIRKFHGQTIVVKYGGSLMVQEERKRQFATDIVLMKYVGMNPVIVHGGGKEITRWMEKIGKEAVFVDGLRVTDSETMELTEMVLSGKINNEVVTLINQAGGRAVGLSGKDAFLISARKQSSKGTDLGYVGEVNEVDPSVLSTLSEKGYIPVIASVSNNAEGHSMNLNADHVAAELAAALKALKLIFLTDVQGVFADGQLQSVLSLDSARELLTHKDIKSGMIPKLTCSIEALVCGVQQVHIINGGLEHAVLLELFTDVGIGTMIERNLK